VLATRTPVTDVFYTWCGQCTQLITAYTIISNVLNSDCPK